MTSLLRALACAVVGLLFGAGTLIGLQQAPSQPTDAESGTAAEHTTTARRTTTPAPAAPTAPAGGLKPAPVPAPEERILLAWTPGGLPDGFGDTLATVPRLERLTVVGGGLLEMTASHDAEGRPVDVLASGFVIPLDAIAFHPDRYAGFAPKSAAPQLRGLEQGEVLLGERSAVLRRLGPGGTLQLGGGRTLTVAGVVDDQLIGGAEVALRAEDAVGTPAAVPRYALLTYSGERAAVEQAVREALPAGTPLRLRGPGETPYLRHGDAVLPQAVIKERFGEFAYRPEPGRDFIQDPDWTAEHIVTADVPLIGEVRCHRALVHALAGALGELQRGNLSHLVDPAGYAGCHSSRLVSAETSVSRHAWGVAVDLNFPKNPVGQASAQDTRLVEVMERWGFTWGGQWLVPDPAHFEYLRPPPLEGH